MVWLCTPARAERVARARVGSFISHRQVEEGRAHLARGGCDTHYDDDDSREHGCSRRRLVHVCLQDLYVEERRSTKEGSRFFKSFIEIRKIGSTRNYWSNCSDRIIGGLSTSELSQAITVRTTFVSSDPPSLALPVSRRQQRG